jgi:predicted enzyme related to lactoylglutathione lyase
MDAALPFYEAFLPVVGFTTTTHGPEWKCFDAPAELPREVYFALTEEPAHRPNANRIAFWADTRKDVDRAAAAAREGGAQVTSGPQEYPEYGPGYYAVFFEDPSGNRLEVMHRSRG